MPKVMHGDPMPNNLEDISWLEGISDCDSLNYAPGFFIPSIIAELILCTFVFLNVLILLFTVLYLGI